MLDNPVVKFLCEERNKGNIGYVSGEFIRKSLGFSRNGHWNGLLDDLVKRDIILKGLEIDGFRRFIYRVSDEVFDKWLISIMKQQ